MSLFKEFTKSSVSDNRTTLESKYEEKMKEFIKNDDQGGMSEYLLNVIPIMIEYYKDDSDVQKEEKTYMNDFVKKEKTGTKGKMYREYMSHLDNTVNSNDNISNKGDICKKCDISCVIDSVNSLIICPKCGECNHVLLSEEYTKSSVSQSTMERVEFQLYYAYKRSNHFNEWLAQFQAKQTTIIPDEIFEKVLNELKKERIIDTSKVTTKKIREYLKKLKLNKYYEHIPYIITRIQGKAAPSLTPELEEKLKIMFSMIQEPFAKHCPKDRKNFLSYSYTLHKFCELLGQDDLLCCFPLLKSREKLHIQDVIWRGICSELGWEFYPSI